MPAAGGRYRYSRPKRCYCSRKWGCWRWGTKEASLDIDLPSRFDRASPLPESACRNPSKNVRRIKDHNPIQCPGAGPRLWIHVICCFSGSGEFAEGHKLTTTRMMVLLFDGGWPVMKSKDMLDMLCWELAMVVRDPEDIDKYPYSGEVDSYKGVDICLYIGPPEPSLQEVQCPDSPLPMG